MTTDEEALTLSMVAEMAATALVRGPALLEFAPHELLPLIGLLQLASRHPGLGRDRQRAVRGFIDRSRAYFSECPTVLALIDRGDDPACDGHLVTTTRTGRVQ